MERIIAKVLITMLALLITSAIIPGITITGIWAGFWSALILGIVNVLVKPIFTIITLPLTIMSLGFFLFIINGLMLLLAASLVSGFYISSIFSAIIGSILLSIISSMIYRMMD